MWCDPRSLAFMAPNDQVHQRPATGLLGQRVKVTHSRNRELVADIPWRRLKDARLLALEQVGIEIAESRELAVRLQQGKTQIRHQGTDLGPVSAIGGLTPGPGGPQG